VGASGWAYIEPFDGDVAAALAGVRQREFERVFIRGAQGTGILPSLPGQRPVTTLHDLDALREAVDAFGGEGTHTIIDVWELVDPAALDDHNTVRPLSGRECVAIFGTAAPSRADYERAQRRYDAHRPGSWALWNMPRWSAWCQPLKDDTGHTSLIAFWGTSGD
jgi:hypothetical protein